MQLDLTQHYIQNLDISYCGISGDVKVVINCLKVNNGLQTVTM